MDDIETIMVLEEEKKNCLKNLQSYYKKYGCEKIEILRSYLIQLRETIQDVKEIEEIKKQLDVLDAYS